MLLKSTCSEHVIFQMLSFDEVKYSMKLYMKFINNLKIPVLPTSEQKKLIDAFPEPKDDYDRVKYHYRCRFYRAPKGKMILLNLLGYAGIIACLFFYVMNRLRAKKVEKHEAVLINSKLPGLTYDDKIPEELYEEFSDIHALDFSFFPNMKAGIFTWKAFKCWLKLAARMPLSGYACFTCLATIMDMQRLIYEYGPRAILNYRVESSIASSMITCFCEQQGIEYICFMHGDYVLSKERAFVRFSRMYLWDEHYVDIFKWSRCPAEQLKVYMPKAYHIDLPEMENGPAYDFTYYLNGDDAQVQMIVDMLKKQIACGLKCKIRPHPRFSDREKIEKLCSPEGITVEDPLKESLAYSIANTRYVIGRCSTVLSQAYYAGKKIIIDDVSEPESFEQLAKQAYIMINKPHQLVSEFIKDGVEKNNA